MIEKLQTLKTPFQGSKSGTILIKRGTEWRRISQHDP